QARVRDVPYPHALPGHAVVRAARTRRAHRAQGLAALRHRARRLRAEADDRGAAPRRLRVVLPAPVLAPLDLAQATEGLARGPGVPRNVVSLQALEPLLAPADPLATDRARLASADRAEPAKAPPVSPPSRP